MKRSILTNLAILAISLTLLSGCSNKNNKYIEDDNLITEVPVEKKSITLSFAGDVTLGNYYGSSYYGTFDHEFENQNGDYSYFLKNVEDIFKNDDLTVVNLEGPLTNTSITPKSKKFAFKGSPSYVNILKSGGVDSVTLANNHSEDYYEDGINDTKNVLKENSINYFGLGESTIIDLKGIKIGLLGYNGWTENYTDEFLNNIKEDIDKIKNEADLVSVYFHWGKERSNYPNQTQIDFAHFAIDSGADLVIGSHPHVVQGIEKYKDKYIAYSLGNFCFGGNKNPYDKDSFIYQQTFNFEGNNLISADSPKIIPCSISSSINRNNYQPTPLEGDEAHRVISKLEAISEVLNID